MNSSISGQQLREALLSLGVHSPDLANRAGDPLKSILADSREYHKLKDQEFFAQCKYKNKKVNGWYFLWVVILIAACYWFVKFGNLAGVLFGILIGVIIAVAVILGIRFVIQSYNDYRRYQTASKEIEKFVENWVEKVQAHPETVEQLMSLNHQIQACESLLHQRVTTRGMPFREQTIEYILAIDDDPAQLLTNFFATVDSSQLNREAKDYLNKNSLLYALIYLYSPDRLQPFMQACYDCYLKDPYSFNTNWIEESFDQLVLKPKENEK